MCTIKSIVFSQLLCSDFTTSVHKYIFAPKLACPPFCAFLCVPCFLLDLAGLGSATNGSPASTLVLKQTDCVKTIKKPLSF